MRVTQGEKMEMIRLVESADLPAKKVLQELDVPRSSFYRWYDAYQRGGYDALAPQRSGERQFWNKIPEEEKEKVVDQALKHPEQTPRELAWNITDSGETFISESSVYRILKAFDLVTSPTHIVISAADTFKKPTCRVHELWQTDFTYFKIVGWGWYYLLTVLDDFSRYIIAWKLYEAMTAEVVKDLLEDAVARTGVQRIQVRHRPILLSDNGPCFISKELRTYLESKEMKHTRSRPYHPMTQGKIERYHRSLKNVVTLQNYYAPWELEPEVARFVSYYNNERVHESLKNLTPADVYRGRGRDILTAREKLKQHTMRRRRQINMGRTPDTKELIRPSLFRECVS